MTSLPDLHAVLARRHSVRGFAPTPVPAPTLEAIFAAAQQAPSWCNVQPWRVTVTHPPRTAALAQAMQQAARTSLPHPDVAFPMTYPEPYDAHRKVCGGALYRAMGVARDDKAGRYDAWLRNYAFFDAPHLAVVACDRRLGPYAFVDVGVWLGLLLAAATAAGVATCAMASVAAYPDVLRAELALPADETILLGVALGYADDQVAANTARTDRSPLGANVRFVPAAEGG